MSRIFLLVCFLWQFAIIFADSTICANGSDALKQPKIVIVGSGPSGIACATKLIEYGFENVQVLEAEPRIGGRINTIPFGRNVIDLGAEWCDGQVDNVVYELASKYNAVESSNNFIAKFQYIRSNREVLPNDVNRRLKDIIEDKDLNEIRKYNGSFGSYITNVFNNALKLPENVDLDQVIAKEFFENFKKEESSLHAANNLDELSPQALADYADCEGEKMLHWKGKGYKELLRLLMKSHDLGTELGVLEKRVILSKTVAQIKWNADNSSVEIKCEDGEIIQADHVIVTVSLGVLKAQHAVLFKPKLPAEKLRAIDGIPFGTLDKIFLEFSKPFWPANWTGVQLLWRESDLAEIRGTSRAWLEDLLAFNIVIGQPNLLQGWIFGKNARYMETLPKEEIHSGVMFLLRKFLSWEIPDPVNMKTTAWSTNVHFRGSYSYRSLDTAANSNDLLQPLKDKCNKPIVQFAGEATNEHRYGSVHGAVETGYREAKVLAELYDKLKRPTQV